MATFDGLRYSANRVPDVTRVHFETHRNSGAALIALAARAGASRIILLGYDCQHTGGKAHWHGDHPPELGNARSVDKWPAAFRALARSLPAGVKVINCSRATALDCFPRAVLENVLT